MKTTDRAWSFERMGLRVQVKELALDCRTLDPLRRSKEKQWVAATLEGLGT